MNALQPPARRIIIIEDPSDDFASRLLSEGVPGPVGRQARPEDDRFARLSAPHADDASLATPLAPVSNHGDAGFDVFLCHSSNDAPQVQEVARELKSRGVSYWLDEEQIGFGDAVTAKIEDGLRRSRCIVPCVSENLASSGWTRAEYGSILNAEFSGYSRRIVIPLMLGGAAISDLPILLQDKKRVCYTDSVEFERFVQFLLQA